MFDPWVGKIPWRRKWQPPPVSLPGKCRGQRSLVAESDMAEQLSARGLNNRILFSYSSGGWESKIEMPVGLVSGENCLPGLQMTVFLKCPDMVERERDLMSLPERTTVLQDQGPMLMNSVNPNYLLKSSVSKYSHFGGEGPDK